MKDNKKISNEYHELESAAKDLNVPVWQVMKAKEEVGNVREDVYKHILGVEITEGYALLKKNQITKQGDEFFYGGKWHQLNIFGKRYNPLFFYNIRRKL